MSDGQGQMEISFQPGIVDQFPEFLDCIRASVYGCGRQLKAIAADLDMSRSRLSRMLAHNPDDPLNFPLDRLPDLLAATNDMRPLYWLIEKFLDSPERRRNEALAELARLAPQINMLLRRASDASGETKLKVAK